MVKIYTKQNINCNLPKQKVLTDSAAFYWVLKWYRRYIYIIYIYIIYVYIIYIYIEEYNPNKKWKILVIFDNFVSDTLINKKLSQ